MTIIWCMVPEIWSATDRIFCHFGLFFALLPFKNPENQNFENMKKMLVDNIILHICTINANHMVYVSWDMEHDRQFFLILDHLFPFYPLNNPENQNFEKLKKMPGNIIISHKCTINDNHMMYDSWDMKHNRQNFL